jgi:hypothetical protein
MFHDRRKALLHISVRDSSREFSVVAGMHEQTHTPAYKTRNWPAYNKALKRRGSLTIWFDPEMSWEAAPTGRRGRQQTYSDTAIQTCLTMKVLFGMALRQTRPAGFIPAEAPLSSLQKGQRHRSRRWPFRGTCRGCRWPAMRRGAA